MSAADPSDPATTPTPAAPIDVCPDAAAVPRPRAAVNRFRFTCPTCLAELTLSARRLVVRADVGTPAAGELVFICLSCDDTGCLGLDARSVATLADAGVAVLTAQP